MNQEIHGYRDLSEQEITLINRIKEHGEDLRVLVSEVQHFLDGRDLPPVPLAEEPARWAALGATDLQRGLMALTRAVAAPRHF